MLALAARSLLRNHRFTSAASAGLPLALAARRLLSTPPSSPSPPPSSPPSSSAGSPKPNAPPQTPTQPPTSERTPPPPPGPSTEPSSSTPTSDSPLPPDPAAAPSPASFPSLDITTPSTLPVPPPPQSAGGSGRTGAKAASMQTSIDRQRRYLARLWTGLMLAGAVGGVVYMGREWDAAEREQGLDGGLGDGTWYTRFRRRAGEAMDYFNKPQWKELLPPPLPFPHGRPYTLVIDIDDLLVASTWDRQHGWRTAKRPGVDYFLAYLSQFYEVVVFTTQYVYSAQPVLESLDPFSAYIQYRLFRESARMHNGELVKDLSYLNRDLSKVIMLDTVKEHAALQPSNAIILPKWKGTPGDTGLVGLIPFLESIAIHKVPDVRPILEKYDGKDIPSEYARVEAEQKRLAIEEWQRTHPSGSVGSGLSRFTLSSIFGNPSAPGTPPAGSSSMPMSYLEQKRAEAQQIYLEEQKYFRDHGEEMTRLIEEDKQRQLKEMKGSLFGYLGLGAGQAPGGKDAGAPQGAGAMAPPVGAGTTGQTPPVVGHAAGAAGKSA